MKKTNAVYIGIDNMEEVEVVFTPKTRREIQRIAKANHVPEVELLAQYLGQISLAGLAGVAFGMRSRKTRR